jgi:DNA (cytosine-5)-methyltransferase 1
MKAGECVFSSEWDTHSRKTYEHNYKKTAKNLFESGNFAGDITKKLIQKKFQTLMFCVQGFRVSLFLKQALKKGFNETRGTLFFDIVNIIKEKQPEAFFLENVRHLLKHNDRKTFEVIKRTIEKELGYSFFYKIVKASDFGLPQNRPRLFMVGFKDKKIDFEFPESIPLEMTMSDIWGGECPKKNWIYSSSRGKRIKY